MSAVAKCRELTQQLATLLEKGNVEAAQPVVKQIKLSLIQFSVLRGSVKRSPQTTTELAAAIPALESCIFYSIQTQDDTAFARFFAQLRSFYSMTTADTPNRPRILGLNLLRLLVDGELGDFHSELELIPQALVSSESIQFPIELERSLMEGMYNQVLVASHKCQDPLFKLYFGSYSCFLCHGTFTQFHD